MYSRLVSSGFRLLRPIFRKLNPKPCSTWDLAGDLGGGGRGSDVPSALFLASGEFGGFLDFEEEEEEVPDSSLEGCDDREGSPNILSQSSICVSQWRGMWWGWKQVMAHSACMYVCMYILKAHHL